MEGVGGMMGMIHSLLMEMTTMIKVIIIKLPIEVEMIKVVILLSHPEAMILETMILETMAMVLKTMKIIRMIMEVMAGILHPLI